MPFVHVSMLCFAAAVLGYRVCGEMKEMLVNTFSKTAYSAANPVCPHSGFPLYKATNACSPAEIISLGGKLTLYQTLWLALDSVGMF